MIADAGRYALAIGFITKTTGMRVERQPMEDCLLGIHLYFFDNSGNQLDVWMRENDDSVQLSTIGARQKETGMGTRFVNALKQYSDYSGKKLVIPDITAPAMPYWNRFRWLVDDHVRIDDCGKNYWPPNTKSYTPRKVTERQMNKTIYIAGMPEGVKENGTRMQELQSLLREGGYETTGREEKEPWQMTRDEFARTAMPLPDRKDFIKAWLKDNENIPDLVRPGFNLIEQRNGSLLVFGNQRGQAIGIISFRKDAVEHIAVSDRYKGRGIATQLLEESRKYGVRRVTGQVSPEAAGIVHRFMVKTAFLEGKPVPPYVLREYPDLVMKAEKQKWRRA